MNGLTREQILERFPRASEAFIRANMGQGQVSGGSREVAKLEPDSWHEPLAAPLLQKANSGRFFVSVVAVRQRLLDEDNLCEKFLVDQCRYAGLIPDDNPEKTKIEVSQRKCQEDEPEHVIVDIYTEL